MKLFVISDTKPNKNEKQIVYELFKNGLDYYHLRKRKWADSEIKQFIEYFPKKYRKRIVIHSNHELINKIEVGGIHINKNQRHKLLTPLKLKILKMMRPNLIYSTSISGINGSNWIPNSVSYVFLSNVFDGISRNSSHASYSLEAVKEFIEKTQTNVVVLGGVDTDNIEKIKEMGFYGCALVGGLWRSKNPIKKFSKIKAMCA